MVRKSSNVSKLLVDEARERAANPREIYGYAHLGYPNQWKQVNRHTHGFKEKKFVILAARPKVGKSMLLAQWVPLIAEQAPPDQVFRIVTREMSAVGYQRRMASLRAGIKYPNRILQGKLTPEELDRYEESLYYIGGLPIEYWEDDLDTTVLRKFIAGEDMTGQGRERKATFMWALDHAGLLANVSGSGSTYQQLVGTANALMNICHDICTGIIITHANRSTVDGMPTADNLAGTDSYGKNYDNLFLLGRPLMNATPDVIEANGGRELIDEGEPAILTYTSRDEGSATIYLLWSANYASLAEMDEDEIMLAQSVLGTAKKGKK